MATGAKNQAPKNDGDKPIGFEEALTKLESIVETMESGELSLEDMLNRYEEGARLAKVCQSKLSEAELRIQQLEKSAGGDLGLKPWAENDSISNE